MDGTATISDATIRHEPRGTNLLDLVLLVAGFGLYWCLPSFGYQPGRVPWLQASRDLDWWYTISATLVEMMERAGLVLAIVAFARRVRLGGLAKPGEFLLAFVAMYWVLTPAAGSMWALNFRTPAAVSVGSITFSLSMLVLVRWRRRLPGWTSTVLIAVAYLSMTCVLLGVSEFASNLDFASGLPIAVEFALNLPFALFFNAPYVAALGDGWSAHRRWSAFEWGGMVLATAWFFVDQVHSLTSALLSIPVLDFLEPLFVSWAIDLVGLVVGLWLARRLAPAFRDWFAPA